MDESKLNKLVDTLIRAIEYRTQKKPKAYTAQAEVVRVQDGIAWVHIPGGVSETPVRETISCRQGDTVQIRVENGTATLTGNRTAPPTDDKKANEADANAGKAMAKAKEAETIAEEGLKEAKGTSNYFWHIDGSGAESGAHVTEIPQAEFEANPSGGNTLITSAGMTIRKGLQKFGEFLVTGLTVYNGSGTKIAQLGYGPGNDSGGGISDAPYYDIGIRTNSYKGNYSVVEGYGNIAGGYGALAEGVNTRAEAFASHASGYQTMANRSYQFVCGVYNSSPLTDDMLFIVGNGTSSSNKSNAFEVHDDGQIKCGSKATLGALDNGIFVLETHQILASQAIAGGAHIYDEVTFTKAGYYPLCIAGWNAPNTIFVASRLRLKDMAVGSVTVAYDIYNPRSSSGTSNFNADILWLKV